MAIQQDNGWIYVLDNNLGHFKIGRARVLNHRVKQLKILLPFPVSIAYCFQTDNHKQVESGLHRHFRHRRLNGEWFTLDTEDFAFIHEIAECSGYYELPSGEMVRDRFYEEPKPEPEMSFNDWLEEHMEELDIETEEDRRHEQERYEEHLAEIAEEERERQRAEEEEARRADDEELERWLELDGEEVDGDE